MEMKPLIKKGLWQPEEDMLLKKYVEAHGEGNWTTVSKQSGLMRGAKSCRLRWRNYLNPNIKRGMITEEEEDLIIRMHKLLGNRWSLIAGRIPGRTDNEVKNYWNSHLSKRFSMGKRKRSTCEDNNKRKKPCLLPNPDCSSENATTDLKSHEEEESVITDLRLEDMENFIHDINSPISPANCTTTFFYADDQAFIPSMDSFVLFEATEFNCKEVNSWEDMQLYHVYV